MVFLGGVGLTALATWELSEAINEKDRVRFATSVTRRQDSISDRIATCITILRGAAGLFAAEQHVTRDSFHDYAERLRLSAAYPGIQGVGYSRHVRSQEREELLEELRAEGVTMHRPGEPEKPLEFWAEGPSPEEHAIVYLEPLDRRNHAAIGFNMFSNPTRRRAMLAARDSGEPAASGRVTLVQEIFGRKQAGFLIYVPVYRGGDIPKTIDERRARHEGYVYSPYRVDDLLAGLFPSQSERQLDYEIYDESIAPENLLHASAGAAPADPNYEPRFRTQTTANIAGRQWVFVFHSRPEFDTASGQPFLPLVFIIGSAITLILSLITGREVTMRERAVKSAQDIKEAEARLRLVAAKNASIIEGAIDCIVTMDSAGRITEFNPAAERVFGYARSEVIGKEMSLCIIPPGLRVQHREGLQRYLSIGEAHVIGSRIEITAMRKGGSEFPVELTVTRNPGDDPATFTGFVRDLTNIKTTEKLLREESAAKEQLLASERAARTEAERAGQLKDEFLATLSHELRTPLNAILGWSQILRRHRVDPQQVNEGLDVIERNARVQVQLIEDLLDMSRIISGNLRMNVQRIDLSEVIQHAVESAAPAAEAKQISLEKVLDHRVGPVNGDPARLQQVVWNLLTNAIKFTPKGGKVQVVMERLNSHVEITVTDDGMGIAPEFLPHVFERFRQVDGSTTRKHGGLGLGLAIVKSIVEAHSGKIRAKSPGLGLGAAFSVELPLARLEEDGRSRERKPPHVASGDGAIETACDSPMLDGISVLVVDDENDARDLIRRLLEERRATVETAANAAEALSILRRQRPDVLLSDIGMPDEDGYELIRRVRHLPADTGGNTPAAAITAFARSEDRRRALLAGFQSHVTKPVEPSELIKVVASLAGVDAVQAEPSCEPSANG